VVSLQILLAGFGGCLCRGDEGLAGVVGEVGGFGLLVMVVGVVLPMWGYRYLKLPCISIIIFYSLININFDMK